MKSASSSRGEGTDPYEEKWAEEEFRSPFPGKHS